MSEMTTWDVWDFSDNEPEGFEVKVGKIEAYTYSQAYSLAKELYSSTAEVEPAC